MQLDTWHRTAQAQLRRTTATAAAHEVNAVALDRSAALTDAFAFAMSQIITGAQLTSARWALAYMAAVAPPQRPPDLNLALARVQVTPEDPRATAGLTRLWEALDNDVPEDLARAAAGSFAGGVATDGVQAAMRSALDEGTDASGAVVRWRLDAAPGACAWCQFLADTGARYLEADTVPVPHSPANARHPGGVCGCSPAAVTIESDWTDPDEPQDEFDGGGELSSSVRAALDDVPVYVAPIVPGEADAIVRDTVEVNLAGMRPEVIRNFGGVSVEGSAFADNRAWGVYYDTGNMRSNVPQRGIALAPSQFTEFADAALRRNEDLGWFSPDGPYGAAQRTLTHELGHFLDYQLTGEQRTELMEILRHELGASLAGGTGTPGPFSNIVEAAGESVSTYAGTNARETIAELWAEYKTAPAPRGPARATGRFIQRALGGA